MIVARREHRDRSVEVRDKRQEESGEEKEEERIQRNGGRKLFPCNHPETSHREWAARSPVKY